MDKPVARFLIFTCQFGDQEDAVRASLAASGHELIGVVIVPPDPSIPMRRLRRFPLVTSAPMVPAKLRDGAWWIDAEGLGAISFALNFSGGTVHRDVVSASQYGSWHFVDNPSPAGIGAIASGARAVHRMLVADDGRRRYGLIEGWLRVFDYSAKRTERELIAASKDWPSVAFHELESGFSRDLVAGAEPDRNVANVNYLVQSGRSRVGALRRRLGTVDEWAIGMTRAPVAQLMTGTPDVDWAENPPGTFLADPFGFEYEGEMVILAESFNYSEGRGRIVRLTWDPLDGWGEVKPWLDNGSHLSYPSVVVDGNVPYVVPESARSGGIDIWEWKEDRPIQIGNLLTGIRAVDPTIVRHLDLWYLFCTDGRLGPNSRLHIYCAEELMGPWWPHTLSPVKVDVRSSRPAGNLFVHEGLLYRPAQDCSSGYGAAVVFNHVEVLTPTEFAERTVGRLDPYPERPDGLHTISSVGSFTVIDGLRRKREFRRIGKALRSKAVRARKPA